MEPRAKEVSGESAEAFYQEFSAQVGLRDWLAPNPRHEQLKLLMSDALAGSSALRIFDFGCGAGVMSHFMTRYGAVVASDFSVPAVQIGQLMAPRVEFRAGRLDGSFGLHSFDVVTLFDVLEHIEPDGRAALLRELRAKLAPGGRLFLSTPHPRYTRWLHEKRRDLLQAIDEPVELGDLLTLTSQLGLQLLRYDTYEIDGAGPQYQLMVFGEPAEVGTPPTRPRRLVRRLGTHGNPVARVLRRARIALGPALRGHRRSALWFVVGKGRPPRSLAQGGAPRHDA